MARPDVVMSFEAGEPRTGGWCERCSLPSLIEFDINILTSTPTGTPIGAQAMTRVVCVEHDVVRDD